MEFPAPVELVVAEELSDNQVKVSWRTPGANLYEPFIEDFSNGLSAWTSSATNWGINQSANAGGVAPELRFNWSPSGVGDFTIISPAIPLAYTNNELYLSFKHMVNDFSGGYSLKVITVADGVTHVVEEFTPTGSISATTFSTVITDADGLNSQDFKIGFMFSGDSFDINYWYIDDISLTNTRAVNTGREIPESTLAGYNVYRTSCVEGGDLQFLGYTLDTLFNDNTWGSAASGMYKWAVEAVYAENESEARFSNCLDKDMVTTVSVTVSTNSTDGPEETDVMFTNTSEPDLELVYETELDETGYFAWDEFRKGTYDIYVEKNGFAPIEITDFIIDGPKAFTWLLEELLLPVADLHVTPTGFATWRQGGVVPFADFSENFDEGIPETWTIVHAGTSSDTWYMETPAGNPQTTGASIDGTPFAYVDSDEAGSGVTLDEMLVSPVIDASSVDALYLHFDQYYNYLSGGEFSKVDVFNGSQWVNVLTQTADAGTWTAPNHQTIDVTEYINDAFQVRFHYFDDGGWKWYWAIDNVALTEEDVDARELEYFKIWLDGVFVADTPNNFYQYDIAGLVEGQEYYSEVAAVYSNGMSAKMDYTWTYYSCENYPGPENLAGSVSGQNVTLTWGSAPPPPPPGDGFSDDFEGHADFLIDFAPWTNVDVDGSATYGMTGITWPNAYAAQSFIVFNPSTTSPALAGADAHSGSKYAACFASVTAPNNDWLISPKMPVGSGTTVSFWAKSYVADYGLERFKVGVSTTGTNPADFTIVSPGSFVEAPATAWTEFSYDLSAYAGQDVYVGINCVSNDAFFLMIDDFTVGAAAASFAFNPPSSEVGSGTKVTREMNTSANTFVNVAETTEAGGQIVNVAGASQPLSSNRSLLHDNGPLVNSPGTGTGGTDESILQNVTLGMTTLGAGCQFAAGNHMADDFVVDANWTVDDFTFYTYQTGSTTTSTITGGYLQIYNGNPSTGGTVIWGDMVTNRMSSTSFSNIYRLSEGTPGTNRPIMEVVCSTPGLTLAPGTYWVEFTLDGSLASGPWAPPITITGQTTTGNALQNIAGVWGPFEDGGSFTIQGLPFLINGTADGGGGGGGGDFETGELLGANVYRDGILIAEMVQDTFYVDQNVDYGMYTYCVHYVYESGAESCSESCVDVEVAFPCDPPKQLAGQYLWTEEAWGSMIEW
ncbi:MAG: choice-of-anchor J domain-containing protein, partial [Tenuifilaceae bacterium]|nr:choice-of-anchor J domain-containing protein [Tenuifilaceae bacterium]